MNQCSAPTGCSRAAGRDILPARTWASTGIWEGVPLREVLWLTKPRENLRRVFYHGYHNDDPKQMFRSTLPVGRVRYAVGCDDGGIVLDLTGLAGFALDADRSGVWAARRNSRRH